MFLRMAAVELRRIAERAPEVAPELNLIAEKLNQEANQYDDLEPPRATSF